MKEISVVIPVHDRAAMLGEAIESVCRQIEPAGEIIVVDDGSTDGSSETASSFPGVTLISQPRGGVSSARNAGIRRARGEWIAFLDSDDLWERKKLKTQMTFMERHPSFPLTHTEEIWIRNNRRVNPGARYRKHGGEIFVHCLKTCFIAASTVMARRDLFDRVGLFDESLPACEDYDMWLRVSSRFPVGYIDSPLTIRRSGHAGQLSMTVPFLDLYRFESLSRLADEPHLSNDQVRAVLDALERKGTILLSGLGRKGKAGEAENLERTMRQLRERFGRQADRQRPFHGSGES